MGTPTLAERGSRALAVTLVTVPAVVLAHLVTAGAAPGGRAVVLVGAAVLLAAFAVPARTRWGLAGVVAVAQLAGHAVLAVAGPTAAAQSGCLSVVGRGASLGMRLAILRQDAACPPGTLAVTTGATAGVAAVLAALLVLAGQAAVAGLAAALLAFGTTAWTAATDLADALADGALRRLELLLALLGYAPQPVPVRRTPRPDADRPLLRTGDHHPATSVRRGPPCTG